MSFNITALHFSKKKCTALFPYTIQWMELYLLRIIRNIFDESNFVIVSQNSVFEILRRHPPFFSSVPIIFITIS